MLHTNHTQTQTTHSRSTRVDSNMLLSIFWCQVEFPGKFSVSMSYKQNACGTSMCSADVVHIHVFPPAYNHNHGPIQIIDVP